MKTNHMEAPFWRRTMVLCTAGALLGMAGGCEVTDRLVRPPDPPATQSAPADEAVVGTITPAAATAEAPPPAAASDTELLPIDLPTALRLTNTSNPTIALARTRLDEAYAALKLTQVYWLPNLITGPAYQRHDGEIQNSTGIVFATNKQNLFMGGGATVSLETSQAYFGPLVARRLVDAQAAATRTVNNDVELDVALTYLDLLRAFGQLAINTDTLVRAEDLLSMTEKAQAAGLAKLPADVNRARSEVDTRRRERINIEGDIAVISARLAQLLLLRPTVELEPTEPTVVPVTLVPCDGSLDDLIATGLMNRPELAESRALVAAALARWRQARISPLLPRIDVTYTAGTFGGGIDSQMDRFNSRGDGSAQVLWTGHNLFLGDLAQTRIRRIQYEESNLRVTEIEAQVAAEVTAAARIARAHRRSLDTAQAAVEQALRAWEKLRIEAYGMASSRGDKLVSTLDPLIAIQTLSAARTNYLTEVVEYNKAQFRLFVAMGQPPIAALPKASDTPPVAVPPAPPPPVLPPLNPKKP